MRREVTKRMAERRGRPLRRSHGALGAGVVAGMRAEWRWHCTAAAAAAAPDFANARWTGSAARDLLVAAGAAILGASRRGGHRR